MISGMLHAYVRTDRQTHTHTHACIYTGGLMISGVLLDKVSKFSNPLFKNTNLENITSAMEKAGFQDVRFLYTYIHTYMHTPYLRT